MTIDELMANVPKMLAHSIDVLHRTPDTLVVSEDHWDEYQRAMDALCTIPKQAAEWGKPLSVNLLHGLVVYRGDARAMGDMGAIVGRYRDVLPYIKWDKSEIEEENQ